MRRPQLFGEQLFGEGVAMGAMSGHGFGAPMGMAAAQLMGAGLPGRGDLVAIDCEFVALDLEEAEVMADGRRVVRKEMRLSLGRVSVLDGREPHGPGTNLGGTPFIDDYIINSDIIFYIGTIHTIASI